MTDTTVSDNNPQARPVPRVAQGRAWHMLRRCLTPARASRGSDCVHRIALRVQAQREHRLADDLLGLSTALNERRHALIQCRLGSDDYRQHVEEIRYLIGRLPVEVGA